MIKNSSTSTYELHYTLKRKFFQSPKTFFKENSCFNLKNVQNFLLFFYTSFKVFSIFDVRQNVKIVLKIRKFQKNPFVVLFENFPAPRSEKFFILINSKKQRKRFSNSKNERQPHNNDLFLKSIKEKNRLQQKNLLLNPFSKNFNRPLPNKHSTGSKNEKKNIFGSD